MKKKPESSEEKRRVKGTSAEYQTHPGGQFKIGNPGRPEGSQNFTTKVRAALLKIADGKQETYEELLVKTVLHKALVEKDEKMIKLIWNYLDGMPKQDMNIESEGLMAELERTREQLNKMLK